MGEICTTRNAISVFALSMVLFGVLGLGFAGAEEGPAVDKGESAEAPPQSSTAMTNGRLDQIIRRRQLIDELMEKGQVI